MLKTGQMENSKNSNGQMLWVSLQQDSCRISTDAMLTLTNLLTTRPQHFTLMRLLLMMTTEESFISPEDSNGMTKKKRSGTYSLTTTTCPTSTDTISSEITSLILEWLVTATPCMERFAFLSLERMSKK